MSNFAASHNSDYPTLKRPIVANVVRNLGKELEMENNECSKRPCYNSKCEFNGSSKEYGFCNDPFCYKYKIDTIEDESKCNLIKTYSEVLNGE